MCPDRVQGQSKKENALTLHKIPLKLSGLLLHGLMLSMLSAERGCWLSGVSRSCCPGPLVALWKGVGDMVGVTSEEVSNQRVV